jgi:hypothetical protein
MNKSLSLFISITFAAIAIDSILYSYHYEKFASTRIVVGITVLLSMMIVSIVSMESKITALEKEISRLKKHST